MRKKLGQHFIRSERVALEVVDSTHIRTSLVVEIGPGKGILTERLLEKGKTVIAIEKDADLVSYLQERFSREIAAGKLIVHFGDVRDGGWLSLLSDADYTVVANIPYYLTGSLIKMLLTNPHQPVEMTLVVQKEVAERIARNKGRESILSLSVKMFGEPKYIKTLPRRLFSPTPNVDSAVITIDAIHTPPKIVQDVFFDIIRTAFHQKRKGVLKKFLQRRTLYDLLVKYGLHHNTRAEEVSFAVWRAVAEGVTDGQGV